MLVANRSRTRVGDWLHTGMRLLILAVLLTGAATVIAAAEPATRPSRVLTNDLAEGQVTYLQYERGSGEVRWATSWWQWYVTAPERVDDGQPNPALRWVQQQVDASGRHIPVHVGDGDSSNWWPTAVVWWPLGALTVVAWIGTFVVMLATPRQRYANRWAWFWMFTIGQVGALLYLVFEPQPLWRARSQTAPIDRKPAHGGIGCLWSILLGVATGVLLTIIATV